MVGVMSGGILSRKTESDRSMSKVKRGNPLRSKVVKSNVARRWAHRGEKCVEIQTSTNEFSCVFVLVPRESIENHSTGHKRVQYI